MDRTITVNIRGGGTVTFKLEDALLIDTINATFEEPMRACWITRQGSYVVAGTKPAKRIVAELGDDAGFVKVGIGRYLNLRRLRAITPCPEGGRFWFYLDSGTPEDPALRVRVNYPVCMTLLHSLGIPHPYNPEPLPALHQILWKRGLRDYPEEIYLMSKELLCRYFEVEGKIDIDRLMENMIWQLKRYLSLGLQPSFEVSTQRGFWYIPTKHALIKLGLTQPGDDEMALLPSPPEELDLTLAGPEIRPSDRYFRHMQLLLAQMVADFRLVSYLELGFEDPDPLRSIGERLPQVVLLAEKANFNRVLRMANQRWGITGVCSGGTPSLMASEFTCQAIRQSLPPDSPIHLVTLVDYDPFGWTIAESFRTHLEFFGLKVASLRHLALPRNFPPEKIAEFSFPLKSDSKEVQARIDNWVKAGQGINGEPRGIQCDSLGTREQVLQIIERECSDLLGSQSPPALPARHRSRPPNPPPEQIPETPIHLPQVDRLVLLGPGKYGLVFLPPQELAVIRNEFQGRLEFVTIKDELFHLSRGLEEVEAALQASAQKFRRNDAGELVPV